MNLNRFISLAALMAALFVVTGCGGISETDLVGTWKMSADVELSKDDPGAQRVLEEFQKALDIQYELREDGTCTKTMRGVKSEGKWELREELVEITDADGANADLYAISDDGNTLTPNGGDASHYFERQN